MDQVIRLVHPSIGTPVSYLGVRFFGTSPLAQTEGDGGDDPGANAPSAPALLPRAYLPLALRTMARPPAPVLNPINNPDGNSSYTLSWVPVTGAATYTLQQDTTSSFSAPNSSVITTTTWSANGNSAGTYYYRVMASNSAGDSNWSNVVTTVVSTVSGPTPGFWESTTGDEFYVTPGGNAVSRFAIYITVNGCGTYKITHLPLASITGNEFSFTGPFYAYGTFGSATTAYGTDGLDHFVINGCGTISGGPWFWFANWQNNTQPPTFTEPAIVLGPDGVAATTTVNIQRSHMPMLLDSNAIDFVTRRWVKCPVETPQDWQAMKCRYNPDDPSPLC